MFSDLQSEVVQHLDEARASSADEPGRMVPAAVRPYGGELMQVKRLLNSVPVVYVEFDVANMETAVHGGGTADGAVSLDIICCTRNQASGQAEYGDGLALLTWTYEQLVGLEVELESGLYYWERLQVGRMMSGKDLYVTKITPDLQITPY